METLIDPTIPCREDADDDVVEVEEMEPSPATNHSEDEEEIEDDDSTGDALEEESINLFVDLTTMGLDMDFGACRDLLEDEN